MKPWTTMDITFSIRKTEYSDSFESCLGCIHLDDSEEMCVLRKCYRAIYALKDCYIPKDMREGGE